MFVILNIFVICTNFEYDLYLIFVVKLSIKYFIIHTVIILRTIVKYNLLRNFRFPQVEGEQLINRYNESMYKKLCLKYLNNKKKKNLKIFKP